MPKEISAKEQLKQILAGKLHPHDLLNLPPESEIWSKNNEDAYVKGWSWGRDMEDQQALTKQQYEDYKKSKSRQNKNFRIYLIEWQDHPPEVKERVRITEERMSELGITYAELDFNITAEDYKERFKTSRYYNKIKNNQ